MELAPKYPVNVCVSCGGDFKVDHDAHQYVCKVCGEKYPFEMLNVYLENIEDPKSMR